MHPRSGTIQSRGLSREAELLRSPKHASSLFSQFLLPQPIKARAPAPSRRYQHLLTRLPMRQSQSYYANLLDNNCGSVRSRSGSSLGPRTTFLALASGIAGCPLKPCFTYGARFTYGPRFARGACRTRVSRIASVSLVTRGTCRASVPCIAGVALVARGARRPRRTRGAGTSRKAQHRNQQGRMCKKFHDSSP